jgi:predicted extracellular nuclease
MSTDVQVAWWNLENLFDSVNAPRDPDLAATLGNELNGWTTLVRDRKISQLASIIELMFAGAGPDLLGVCEVENERVLQMLVDEIDIAGRNYQLLSHASPDARGIDVGFIFDNNVLTPSNQDHQVVIKRRSTRDLFWATWTVDAEQESFVAMGNHWPSRSGGRFQSEPFRMLTAETAAYVVSRMPADTPVLLMGDFNDQPFDRSVQNYLLGGNDRGRVMRARNVRFLNLMWPAMAVPNPGTYRFGSDWNMLDQFLANRPLLRATDPVRVLPATTSIFRPPALEGTGGAPRRFSRPSQSSFDNDGFSDHFPIMVLVRAG